MNIIDGVNCPARKPMQNLYWLLQRNGDAVWHTNNSTGVQFVILTVDGDANLASPSYKFTKYAREEYMMRVA
jgi:hypothetical protein